MTWRFTSGLQNVESLVFFNETSGERVDSPVDLTGGFYNDGLAGPVKVTWNIAMTVSLLSWSLLEYPAFWARDPQELSHAVTLIAAGSKYLLACYGVSPLYNWNRPGTAGSSDKDQIVYVVRFPPLAACIHRRAFFSGHCSQRSRRSRRMPVCDLVAGPHEA